MHALVRLPGPDLINIRAVHNQVGGSFTDLSGYPSITVVPTKIFKRRNGVDDVAQMLHPHH